MSLRTYYKLKEEGRCPVCSSSRDDEYVVCLKCRQRTRREEILRNRMRPLKLIDRLKSEGYSEEFATAYVLNGEYRKAYEAKLEQS